MYLFGGFFKSTRDMKKHWPNGSEAWGLSIQDEKSICSGFVAIMGNITRNKLLASKVLTTYLTFDQEVHDVHAVVGSCRPFSLDSERSTSDRLWRNMDSSKSLHIVYDRKC